MTQLTLAPGSAHLIARLVARLQRRLDGAPCSVLALAQLALVAEGGDRRLYHAAARIAEVRGDTKLAAVFRAAPGD